MVRQTTEPPHPYFTLFHAALAKRGVTVSDDLEIDVRWLKAQAGRLNAIHLHWPESMWRGREFSQLRRLGRASRTFHRLLSLQRFLRRAKRLGIKSLWTLHNLEPHEGVYRWDQYGYRLLARESDVIICHSRWSATTFCERYRTRGRVIVMPIGELASVYPPARPRDVVLTELGLDSRLPVVSCLGRLREYKGFELACEAIGRLDGRVQLVIAGVPHSGFDLEPLLRLAGQEPGIVVVARKLSEQEFADVSAASDAALLPYRTITGSAVLMTAVGFGRGVLASDLPYFREILGPEPDAGVLVPAPDAAVWARAVAEYLARPADVRHSAAFRLAAHYSWDRSVEPVAAVLGCPSEPVQQADVAHARDARGSHPVSDSRWRDAPQESTVCLAQPEAETGPERVPGF